MATTKKTTKKAAKKSAKTVASKPQAKKSAAAAPVSAPSKKADAAKKDAARDPRLPPVGTVIERKFKDKAYEVKVHESDFEFRGRRFRSLSGIAKEITGAQTNGFLWFGLMPREGSKTSA